MMYKCRHFKIKELVHPDMLCLGEDLLWKLFDDRVLMVADWIREKYGKCTVNSGGMKDCGLRKMDSKTGAKYSQHKFGRALDIHIVKIDKEFIGENRVKSYNQVRKELIKELPEYVNFEDNISWLHIDVGNREGRLFQP